MGKNPNQFHPDFKVSDHLDADEDSLVSKCFIGVAKKVYYDKVVGKSKSGTDIQDDYFKMKGISSHIITYTAEKRKQSMRDLYETHHNGEQITYDLNAGGRIRFDIQKDQLFNAVRGKFERKICFKNGEEIEE
jgi:hypothetical protein